MPATEVRVFRDTAGDVPLIAWLERLERRQPIAHAKCLACILELARLGHELRRPTADYLRDGIYELRARKGRVNYRILYFFHGSHAVTLSHGITKEAAVPKKEIDLAVKRKALVAGDPDKYTADWR